MTQHKRDPNSTMSKVKEYFLRTCYAGRTATVDELLAAFPDKNPGSLRTYVGVLNRDGFLKRFPCGIGAQAGYVYTLSDHASLQAGNVALDRLPVVHAHTHHVPQETESSLPLTEAEQQELNQSIRFKADRRTYDLYQRMRNSFDATKREISEIRKQLNGV